MKRLILIAMTILSFAFSLSAQIPTCPQIRVVGPSGITPLGESMTFTTNVSGGTTSTYTYNWTVSAGTIEAGQGNPVISVRTNADLEGQTITASIEVGGLPQNCPTTASALGEV